MISLSKIKSSVIEKGRRILKVKQFGVKTALGASSFGDDSNPIDNMTAIFSDTSENGEPVILGYINKNQIANIGEKRIYSLKQDGSVSSFVWLKNNNEVHIMGDSDNSVRYSKLESAFNELKNDLNSLIQKYNAHQHTAPNGATPPTTQASQTSADITPAKINSIKVP